MLSSKETKKIYICLKCEKEYKHASSLSRHKKTCMSEGPKSLSVQTTEFETFKLDVIKQMDDLKNQIETLKLEIRIPNVTFKGHRITF